MRLPARFVNASLVTCMTSQMLPGRYLFWVTDDDVMSTEAVNVTVIAFSLRMLFASLYMLYHHVNHNLVESNRFVTPNIVALLADTAASARHKLLQFVVLHCAVGYTLTNGTRVSIQRLAGRFVNASL